MSDDVIRTERLDLVSVGTDFMRAALDGGKPAAEKVAGIVLPDGWVKEIELLLTYRLQQIEADQDTQPWLLRLILERSSGSFVGYINFHGPPGPEGWAEIGYTIEPAYRRRGFALEAARGYFAWAMDRGVRRFRASVSPDNEPSLAMVAKMGFEQVGVQWDDIDGKELVFEADASTALGSSS